MSAKKSTIIGAAGAVAAATAVGVAGVAAARRKDRTPQTWHVLPTDGGWVVSRDGVADPKSRHDTKKAAVSAGRKVAGGEAPSTLVLHYADGTVQDRIIYEPED